MLIYIFSDSQMEMVPGQPSPSHSHSFDAGAAWACLALQATMIGYHAHGMVGVDFDRARIELKVPERFRFEAAAVVGRNRRHLHARREIARTRGAERPQADRRLRLSWAWPAG